VIFEPYYELGNTRARVLHTPGHTPESVCLVVTDLRRGGDPWFVLTGDTLFVGAVGRPDLPGPGREHAGQLFDSIRGKLPTLPDEVEVVPAHFAGSACGAGMSGKPSSTIGFERRWSQLLASSREAFVEAVAEVLAQPSAMDEMLRVNRGWPRAVP
jgi:hydroxyacylglutathione hydrolase